MKAGIYMFGYPVLEKDKKYVIPFLFHDHAQLALYGDVGRDIYCTKKGHFEQNKVTVFQEYLIVTPTKRKSYVQEIVTGIEIPLVLMTVQKTNDNEFVHTLYGDSSKLAVAFGMIYENKASDFAKEPFLLRQASKEEVLEYQKRKECVYWDSTLAHVLEYAREVKKNYLMARLEELDEQKKKNFEYVRLLWVKNHLK